MKWFIINTESFSAKGAKDTKIIDKSFLPKHLSLFLQKFGYPYIILDECFVAGTPVDIFVDGVVRSKRIEEIAAGDHIVNALREDTVVGTSRKEVQSIVEISAEGRLFACSENHPFLTVHGWKSAKDIRRGDFLVPTVEAMRVLRDRVYAKKFQPKVAKILRKDLLREMENGTAGDPSCGILKGTKREGIERCNRLYAEWEAFCISSNRANSHVKSYAGEQFCRENDGDERKKRYLTQSTPAGREWKTYTGAGNETSQGSRERMGGGTCGLAREEADGISVELQARPCTTSNKAWYRIRRFFTYRKEKDTRCEEGLKTCFIRVDSAEIQKQGSTGLDKYRDAEGKLYCYDIKASRHHSFSVNGVLVHNSSKIKTTSAMAEHKKSSRCRVIKTLSDVGEKSILTGTLKSKSPLNVYDQFKFLSESFFPETMFEFAERYCVMITIRVGRGRRVCISEKDWNKIRTRMVNAYARGGQLQLDMSRASLFKEYTIDEFNLNWIMSHQVYTPFTRQAELFKRIEDYTMVVKREDVFDISFEKFVHEPIIRYVEISEKAKKIGNELIKLGFTDNIVLGQAPALELTHRLQDLCNGFEPIATVLPDGSREISYAPLGENPKLDALFELLEEIGVDNNQVAIISSRINILEAIEERLITEGITYVHYEKKTKAASEEDFVAGRAQVFLSSLGPSAYGLNCLAKCDYIIYACVDNSTETFYQSKHRILRGQLDHAKFAYMLCVRNSIEERIARSLQRGIELISYRNDKKTFEFK